MNDQFLDAPNGTFVTHATAPGESIPAWLYRRVLYLLIARTSLRRTGTQEIRDTLLTQTGLRIPDRLLTAIDLASMDMNGDHRNRISNFTEAQMSPSEGDFYIEPVPLVRRDAAVPQGAALENIADHWATRFGPRFPYRQVSRLGGGNDLVAANNPEIDANEGRRQRYADADLLLGLERSRPPSTEEDRATQVRLQMPLEGEHVEPTNGYLYGVAAEYPLLRDEMRRINYVPQAEVANRPHVSQAPNNWDFAGQNPTLHYYSGINGLQSYNNAMRPFRPDPNPRPPPPRRFEDVEAAALRQEIGEKAGSKQPNKKKPSPIAKDKDAPAGGPKKASVPRGSKMTPPREGTQRETRATAAKRKQEEEAAAATATPAPVIPAPAENADANADKDQEVDEARLTKKPRIKRKRGSDSPVNSCIVKGEKSAAEEGLDEQLPPTKKPHVMLKLNLGKRKTTKETASPVPAPTAPTTRPSKIVILKIAAKAAQAPVAPSTRPSKIVTLQIPRTPKSENPPVVTLKKLNLRFSSSPVVSAPAPASASVTHKRARDDAEDQEEGDKDKPDAKKSKVEKGKAAPKRRRRG